MSNEVLQLFKVVLSSGGIMWVKACSFEPFVNVGNFGTRFAFYDSKKHTLVELPNYLVDELYVCPLMRPEHCVYVRNKA